ncbi:DUF3325 family protein [Pseudomonas sp. MAFF 302030]|uniref:DUF3325 family protein n=1 Tax=Pseudomonas morbosilactucae TaxID=2938197 RepID=A0A9X1YZN9_9PSED|nr:DUF3325 family protein [Pseudomonas morbosilactucae]MCK9800929.1 DUF3325 family protein [Pseudomonas morbosilactucae]
MADALLNLLVLGLLGMGLSTLALSQASHWRRVMGSVAFPGVRGLRGSAVLVLILALLVSQAGQGLAMGTVFWCLALVPCGASVALLLCWRATWLHRLGLMFRR